MKKHLLLAAVFALFAAAAQAHATFEQGSAPKGAAYKGVMRIGHGCEGEATLKLRVQIPEGVIAVKPMPKAGWTLELVKGAYAASYDYYGEKLAEGVKEIVWTGELPDAYYDEFVFRAFLTEGLAEGATIYFPTIQECAKGAQRWIEIPAEGQDPHSLKSPAPGLKIEAPAHAHH